MFVLNYTGDWLLSDLVQSMPHRTGFWVVVKDDGSYVYHDRDPGRNWGAPDSLDTGMSLFRDFPEELRSCCGARRRPSGSTKASGWPRL